ncbi:hypothetical protein GGI35DRAFT_179810 [Trichoderma velutinum]
MMIRILLFCHYIILKCLHHVYCAWISSHRGWPAQWPLNYPIFIGIANGLLQEAAFFGGINFNEPQLPPNLGTSDSEHGPI